MDSPGGPSSNRRYSITGVLRRRVIMNFTSKGPAEAKSTIALRRIHLIRRPYAKRRGRRETMFDCPLSKTVKILDQRSCRIMWKICQPGRVWKPTLLEDLTDPRNGGRIGRSGRVKAISRRVAAVWPRGAYPWMPRGLWRLPATEGGPWGRPWRVPRTLLRSSALRRSACKSASLLLLCLPRNLCNSNSHPRCC